MIFESTPSLRELLTCRIACRHTLLTQSQLSFKTNNDQFCCNQDFYCNCKCDIVGTGNRSVSNKRFSQCTDWDKEEDTEAKPASETPIWYVSQSRSVSSFFLNFILVHRTRVSALDNSKLNEIGVERFLRFADGRRLSQWLSTVLSTELWRQPQKSATRDPNSCQSMPCQTRRLLAV